MEVLPKLGGIAFFAVTCFMTWLRCHHIISFKLGVGGEARTCVQYCPCEDPEQKPKSELNRAQLHSYYHHSKNENFKNERQNWMKNDRVMVI